MQNPEPETYGECVAGQVQEYAAWQEEEYGGGDPLLPDPAERAEEEGAIRIYATPASRALCQFMHEAGLDRSTAIACDLDSIARSSRGDAPLEINPSQQVRGFRAHSRGFGREGVCEATLITPTAARHVAYDLHFYHCFSISFHSSFYSG